MQEQDVTLPLDPQSLDTNRAGRLSDGQRAALRAYDRGPIGNHLLVAALCVVLAVVLFTSRSAAPHAALRPLAGVVALAAAVGLVLRSFGIGGRLAHDLGEGRVESVEGAVLKDRSSVGGGSGRSVTVYALEVGGRRFFVSRGTHQAAPEAGIVRLYYLPKSRRVVNLERLADRPLPAGALTSPLDALKALAPALRARDSAVRAEAGATLAAMEDAMRLEQARLATPPPASERDPRPLAEAIVGRWHGGPVSLEFAADGTVVATLLGGRERRGRWSVDAAGRLHANAMGHEQAGDAWVVGDALTMTADGEVITLRRA